MTAMPYGPSVPHMFIVVFVIMLPVYLKTNEPGAGLAGGPAPGRSSSACIVLIGAFVGPTIRDYTPRAAMLGALAGISIAFISMRPAVPELAGAVARVHLARHHPDDAGPRNVRLPCGIPGGLAAVLVGTVIAWIATCCGGPAGRWTAPRSALALGKFGLHLPIPAATSSPGWPISGRCWSPPFRSASTISPRA